MFSNVYTGKRVLVTGHTGFKGSWLCTWLLRLNASVYGLALKPDTERSHFVQLGLADKLEHNVLDIRRRDEVCKAISRIAPDFVFHLAAQPLVRLSYQIPLETFETNVMGTVNLLEAIRQSERSCSVIVITTDKCYENREWLHSYREEDALGGHDPYSASKAATEVVAAAYRTSFFSGCDSHIGLATARAGNVIGGGDWATDRIVPDSIRSLSQNVPILVRNRASTRPWQHVLEPLSGYLWLGANVHKSLHLAEPVYCSAFNFGPPLSSNRTVSELVQTVLGHWPGSWEDRGEPKAVHEASKLNLATDKAFHLLGWHSIWPFEDSIAHTVAWYRQVLNNSDLAWDETNSQIAAYSETGIVARQPWAIN